tara:strand:- start:43 stop:207 length:165 start_codon:yes stop_codon:yes gene_type:complete
LRRFNLIKGIFNLNKFYTLELFIPEYFDGFDILEKGFLSKFIFIKILKLENKKT